METLTPAQQELYDWLVEYIRTAQHPPSLRQMMKAMNLRSLAPVKRRLERLRTKGYLDWTTGQARSLRLLHLSAPGLPLLGQITAGGLVEPFADEQAHLDLSPLFATPNCYVLRVVADSLIDNLISEGDLAILRLPPPDQPVPNGAIVAARIPGYGTTLQRFYLDSGKVTLQPSHPDYHPLEVDARLVNIQGLLIAVWRPFSINSSASSL